MENTINLFFKYARTLKSNSETNPIALSNDLQGGLHTFNSKSEMDDFLTIENATMLEFGMLGYDKSGDTYYSLVEDNTTVEGIGAKWVKLETGGGGGEEQKFDTDAIYFVASGNTYATGGSLPTRDETNKVSGYTSTNSMSHTFNCNVFDAKQGYVYFVLPIVGQTDKYYFTINGNIINDVVTRNVKVESESDTHVLYMLSNKLGGKKIVLNVKKDE